MSFYLWTHIICIMYVYYTYHNRLYIAIAFWQFCDMCRFFPYMDFVHIAQVIWHFPMFLPHPKKSPKNRLPVLRDYFLHIIKLNRLTLYSVKYPYINVCRNNRHQGKGNANFKEISVLYFISCFAQNTDSRNVGRCTDRSNITT